MATQNLTAATTAEPVPMGGTTRVDTQGSASQQLGPSSNIMDGPSGASQGPRSKRCYEPPG